jgi:hypothetical protein
MSSDEVTITVSRKDVEHLWRSAQSHDWAYAYGPVRRIHEALPEPEWEPDEDAIRAFAGVLGFHEWSFDDWEREDVARDLKVLHKQGWELRRVE